MLSEPMGAHLNESLLPSGQNYTTLPRRYAHYFYLCITHDSTASNMCMLLVLHLNPSLAEAVSFSISIRTQCSTS